MEAYLLTGAGIIVSVALFLLGYRQTIGAKKERIGAANANLKRILMRRIVQEEYRPDPNDIELLIGGVAREYRIGEGDTLSPEDLLGSIYTDIAASDLIQAEQRNEILRRVTSGIELLDTVAPSTARLSN
ncbi:MAG TPA: hypothetical protein VGI80_03225, partial [Pyrinomonadaceae bacterium]